MTFKKNNAKNALHGFSISVATTVAEPSTILPLIIHHFSSNLLIVGIFTSLLRGGAIIVQLIAAFYAQSYPRMMPYLKIVFFFRFLSWFLIGLSILLVGDDNKTLTLWLIGIGLFFFSFAAGFGGIYFKEVIAKVFNKQERGRTMSNKQFFASFGALLSGGVAGFVLEHFEAPDNYAYLFMSSAILMSVGLVAFASIEEPIKENVSQREESFLAFIKNAKILFDSDARLRLQILITLFGYAFLLAMPFIILKAQADFELTGWLVGGFISVQMLGSMLGNLFLWKKMTHNYVQMMQVAFVLMITLFILALFASTPFMYIMIFLLFLAIMFFQKRIKARHISFLFVGIFLLFTWLSLGGLATISKQFILEITDEMTSRINFFSDTKKTNTSDMDERKVVLFAALEMFGDKPIVGNGIGSTRSWNHRVGPHNTFASNWADFGLLGMLIIPLLFFTASWHLLKFGSKRQKQLAVLVLMHYTFSSFFSHDMLEQPFQFAILVALVSIGEKAKKRYEEQEIQKESFLLGDIEGIRNERLEVIAQEEKEEKEEKEKEEKKKKIKRKKVKKPKGVKPDDLTKLTGIGKVYQKHLNFEGIFTYEDVTKITVWQTAILKEEHGVKKSLSPAISHAKEIIAQRGIVDR